MLRRCFGGQRRHPRRCNLLTGECLEAWWADEAEAESAQQACDRWGNGEFHVGYHMVPPGITERTKQLINHTKVWGLVGSAWRCGETVCNVRKGWVGAHVSADFRVLPPNASEDECSWFAWVRGPSAKVVTEDDVDLGLDDNERQMVSNLIFYIIGAICALAIPFFAYMCATLLFHVANHALFSDEASQHVRLGPTLDYKRLSYGQRCAQPPLAASPSVPPEGTADGKKRVGFATGGVLAAAGAQPTAMSQTERPPDAVSPSSSTSASPSHGSVSTPPESEVVRISLGRRDSESSDSGIDGARAGAAAPAASRRPPPNEGHGSALELT